MSTQTKSAISTAAFVGVMLLLMFFVSGYSFDKGAYEQDNPPKEPPEGFEVSLGEPDRGQGDEPAPTAKEQTTAKPAPAAPTQNTPTQSSSDANVNASDKTVTTDNKTEVSKPKEPEINQNALFPGNRNKNNNGRGQGLGETGTPGNQGQADGNPNSLNPNGIGGGGLSGNVKGFRLVSHPPIKFSSTRTVNITFTLDVKVDKNGNVIEVKYRTSTYSDIQLRDKAIALAKGTKFAPIDGSDIGDEPRRGTITVTFKNTK